jgi:hypothetical protein
MASYTSTVGSPGVDDPDAYTTQRYVHAHVNSSFEKSLQVIEYRMLRRMTPHLVYIMKFMQLTFDLRQTFTLLHPQPYPAGTGAYQGQTEDTVHIECATRKESTDMGHDTRMVVDGQFQYRLLPG